MAVDAVVVVVPEEIIKQEILIRLPIKSLVRFRCVCKSWNSQLYNPGYLSLLNLSVPRNPKRDDDDRLILFMYHYDIKKHNNHGDRYILSGVKQFWETHNFREILYTSSINKVPNYSLSKLDDIHLVGSVNGLVCIAFYFKDDHEHVFILWNPTIRLSKTILVPAIDLGLRSISLAKDNFLYGFGWDSATNDYKIIIKPLTRRISPASVYSSKTDCWSNINDSTCVIDSNYKKSCKPPTCVIANGSPYWKDKDSNTILKFDVTSNEFTSLNLPSDCSFKYSLIDLNDCLALLDYRNRSTQGEGVVHSFDEEHNIWVQMYTIRKNLLSLRSPCFTYDGGIMFHDQYAFWYWYDLKSRELKTCARFDDCGRCLGNGFSYTLSLVALQGMKALHA